MLIQLTGANFATAGLGKVTRLTFGMPSKDLIGLWLADDNQDGEPVTEITDYSGLGNHATLISGWAPAKQRSFGIDVDAADGSAYETPLPVNPAGRQMTVFVAAKNLVPGGESGVFNTMVGATGDSSMADPASNHPNSPHLCLNFNGAQSAGNWQIFDNGGDLIGQTVLKPGGGASNVEPGVAGIGINALSGAATLHVDGVEDAVATAPGSALSEFYDGATDRGNLVIGCWPQSVRSGNSPIAQVFAVAAYARSFTASAAADHMTFLRKIAEARGVTGF